MVNVWRLPHNRTKHDTILLKANATPEPESSSRARAAAAGTQQAASHQSGTISQQHQINCSIHYGNALSHKLRRARRRHQRDTRRHECVLVRASVNQLTYFITCCSLCLASVFGYRVARRRWWWCSGCTRGIAAHRRRRTDKSVRAHEYTAQDHKHAHTQSECRLTRSRSPYQRHILLDHAEAAASSSPCVAESAHDAMRMRICGGIGGWGSRSIDISGCEHTFYILYKYNFSPLQRVR